MTARTRAFVALGSNLGDRARTLQSAVHAIHALPTTLVERVSTWIETAPVGGPTGQPDYLNGVLLCRTDLSARALLDELLEIERRFGRDRAQEVPCGPRTLDLDLLIHGVGEIDEADLVVPHPRMEDRIFVVEPLAQIAPDQVLSRSRVTALERLRSLQDRAEVDLRG